MSWEIGYDDRWQRDIGYGVPATCDHPDCSATIHRGLAYVCGGEPYGGEHGCGLFFCSEHLVITEIDGQYLQLCERCLQQLQPFDPKPDVPEWIEHKATHHSWAAWRDRAVLARQGEGQ